MEIETRIAALDINAIARRDPKALSELREVYQAAFKETIQSGCGNCIRKAYGRLQLLTTKQILRMKKQKYLLKKGVVIEHPAFSGKHYTSDNMTDSVAKKIISGNDEMAKNFDVNENMPDDDEAEKAAREKADKEAAEKAIADAKAADEKAAREKIASKNETTSALKEVRTGEKQSEPAAPIETKK